MDDRTAREITKANVNVVCGNPMGLAREEAASPRHPTAGGELKRLPVEYTNCRWLVEAPHRFGSVRSEYPPTTPI